MALNFFKKKPDDEPDPNGEAAGQPVLQRDPRKAQRFFDHAQTVADARNYKYAIELFISGLRHEPDNQAKHEALRDIALKYKVGGGKPAGLKERMQSMGKDPVSKLLDAEKIWSKDPLNVSLMLEVMERAKEADQSEEGLDLAELVYWVGSLVLEFGRANKKTSDKVFIKARDLFVALGAFDKAVEANRLAMTLRPDDARLIEAQKNLETELTLTQGAYSDAGGEEGGYRKMVKDLDRQNALEQESGMDRSASAIDQVIQRHTQAYQEHPEDIDLLQKLVAALLEKGTDASESRAIELLEQAYQRTTEYRHRARIGDIRIRRLNRELRVQRQKLKDNPQDADAKAQAKELSAQLLKLELAEYTERAKQYPTDMGVRYQLGRSLYAAKQHDDAIAAFQDARADAKYRVQSSLYLGLAYCAKEWFDEAIDTFTQAIEAHPDDSDGLGMGLRYGLMDALSQSAAKNKSLERAQEAQKIASKILQTNIKYRDIRARMEAIRKLVDELREA